jgi:hypothetical protein
LSPNKVANQATKSPRAIPNPTLTSSPTHAPPPNPFLNLRRRLDPGQLRPLPCPSTTSPEPPPPPLSIPPTGTTKSNPNTNPSLASWPSRGSSFVLWASMATAAHRKRVVGTRIDDRHHRAVQMGRLANPDLHWRLRPQGRPRAGNRVPAVRTSPAPARPPPRRSPSRPEMEDLHCCI